MLEEKYNKQDLKLLKELYSSNYNEILDKLKEGYPIQYLIGYVNFYGNKILVSEDVLIPRFETEYLVDETIKLIKKEIDNPKIIDICSGSGCIAISLAKELNIEVDAIDISSKAIKIAKENAKINNVSINYINEDIKKFNTNKKYNVLVSNPPYVKEDEYTSKETKYEPQIALYAKDNGLEYYKVILEQSKTILEDKNIIAFEIGATQANEIKKLANEIFPNANIVIKKDLNNLDRNIYIINN